jgi:putative chitinase
MIIKLGDTGPSVQNWQYALNAATHWAPPLLKGDGEFGPNTDEKTRLFQSASGCASDGVVGPNSREAMGGVGFNQLGAARLFQAIKCKFPKYPVELVADTSTGGWLDFAEITTRVRLAAYYAQMAHESGRFLHLEEIWGPTPEQKRYEPPSAKAKRLGNTKKGDGYRFRGRGPIQTTGRYNYRITSKDLGMGRELEENPDRLAEPALALLGGAAYWARHKLNKYATLDPNDFKRLTKAINGGYNGLADRQKLWTQTKMLLGLA